MLHMHVYNLITVANVLLYGERMEIVVGMSPRLSLDTYIYDIHINPSIQIQ